MLALSWRVSRNTEKLPEEASLLWELNHVSLKTTQGLVISPCSACLGGVANCDAYLAIISSLGGIGNRILMTEPPKNGQYTVGQHADETILAFERPRLIVRKDLEKPEIEINATLTLFRRRLKSRNQY